MTFTHRYKTGDKLSIVQDQHGHGYDNGTVVTVLGVDQADEVLPYKITSANELAQWGSLERAAEVGSYAWAAEDELTPVTGVADDDPVQHPSHYTTGKIEVIEFVEDKQLGFHLGNVVKYVVRAGKKDPSKTVEDLRKAEFYLQREIARLSAGSV